MGKDVTYKIPLNINQLEIGENGKVRYKKIEVETSDTIEGLLKGALEVLANKEDIPVDKLTEEYTIEVDELYDADEDMDTVDITEDTTYLYGALLRLGSNESERIAVWATSKTATLIENAEGKEEEAYDSELLLEATAVAIPMGLNEFITKNSKPTVNETPKQPKTISLFDLKKVTEESNQLEDTQQEDKESGDLLNEFYTHKPNKEFIPLVLPDEGELPFMEPMGEDAEGDSESLYTYEEVKELVDKAFEDGYQKAMDELEPK